MGAVPFDTLKSARKLEALGMTRAVAEAVVECIRDAVIEAKWTAKDSVVTKTDNTDPAA